MLELLLHPHFSCDCTTLSRCQRVSMQMQLVWVQWWPRVLHQMCRILLYYCLVTRALQQAAPHLTEGGGWPGFSEYRHQTWDTGASLLLEDPNAYFLPNFHPHLSNICFGVEYFAKYWPESPQSKARLWFPAHQLLPARLPQLGVSLGQPGLVMQTCHFCVNLHWVSGQLWL